MAIAFKTVADVVRLAIITKSSAKVLVLPATAASEIAPWLAWVTITVKSVGNKVRSAIMAKSVVNV